MLIWHLYLAALAGRDIYYDQRYAHNLEMRAVLEAILTHAARCRPGVVAEIRRYTKLFWINSGPYNNLTARKFLLRLTRDGAVRRRCAAAARGAARCHLRPAKRSRDWSSGCAPIFFDAAVDPVLTNKSPGAGRDILRGEREQPLRRRDDGRPRRRSTSATGSTRAW